MVVLLFAVLIYWKGREERVLDTLVKVEGVEDLNFEVALQRENLIADPQI